MLNTLVCCFSVLVLYEFIEMLSESLMETWWLKCDVPFLFADKSMLFTTRLKTLTLAKVLIPTFWHCLSLRPVKNNKILNNDQWFILSLNVSQPISSWCFISIPLENLRNPGFALAWDMLREMMFCQHILNHSSTNPTKWSNTLKRFVGCLPTNWLSVFDHFVGLVLKGF